MAISKAKRSAAAKKAARTRKRNAAAKAAKRSAASRRRKRSAGGKKKGAARERHLRERLPLRNEEGNQSFRLKNLFFIFFNY